MFFEDENFFMKEIAEKLDSESLVKISALFFTSKKFEDRNFGYKLARLAKQKEVIYVPIRFSNEKIESSYGVFLSQDEAVDYLASRFSNSLSTIKRILLLIGDVLKDVEKNKYFYIVKTERRDFPKLDVKKILKENPIVDRAP